MKKIIFIVLGLLVFSGCNNGNVSKVKDGFLDDKKSLTIGEAFDNFKYFKSTKWTEFKTDSGKGIVQVCCVVDIDKVNADAKDKLDMMQLIFLKGAFNTGIIERTYTVQFTINRDDTFEITNIHIKDIMVDNDTNKYSTWENDLTFNIDANGNSSVSNFIDFIYSM